MSFSLLQILRRMGSRGGPVILCWLMWISHALAQSPSTTEQADSGQSPLQRLLDLWEISMEDLGTIGMDPPANAARWNTLLTIFNRLQQIPPRSLEAWSIGTDDPLSEDVPPRFVKITGSLLDVQTLQLPAKLGDSHGENEIFVCRVSVEDWDAPAVVYVPRVPPSWQEQPPLGDTVGQVGLLTSVSADTEGRALPVLVATALQWHPDTPLGNLGVDVAALESVTDRTELSSEERESFYAILAALSQVEISELWPDQAEATSVVPLFNAPQTQRGELVRLEGRARRVVRVIVDEPDIRDRFGVGAYWEIDMFTPDSQRHPLVVCVPRLPAGFPTGRDVQVSLRVAGFFFKSWAYRTAATENDKAGPTPTRQSVPLILATQPVRWSRTWDTSAQWLTAVLLSVAFCLVFVTAWTLWRWQRREARQRLPGRSLPKQLDLPRDGGEHPSSETN